MRLRLRRRGVRADPRAVGALLGGGLRRSDGRVPRTYLLEQLPSGSASRSLKARPPYPPASVMITPGLRGERAIRVRDAILRTPRPPDDCHRRSRYQSPSRGPDATTAPGRRLGLQAPPGAPRDGESPGRSSGGPHGGPCALTGGVSGVLLPTACVGVGQASPSARGPYRRSPTVRGTSAGRRPERQRARAASKCSPSHLHPGLLPPRHDSPHTWGREPTGTVGPTAGMPLRRRLSWYLSWLLRLLAVRLDAPTPLPTQTRIGPYPRVG